MRTVSLFLGGVEGGKSFSARSLASVNSLNPKNVVQQSFASIHLYRSESLLKVLWDSRQCTYQEKYRGQMLNFNFMQMKIVQMCQCFAKN